MESQSNTQLKVGIFLSAGILCILASIFFLGADKALFTSYVRLHAHFEQVQGLAVGSVVSLSGVNVGNIESIDFVSEKNALDVKMKVNEEFLPRISKNAQVEIRTQGALGDKYIFIIPGAPNDPPAEEGTVLEIAKATDLIGILSERGNETNNIFDIINNLHIVTKTLVYENRIGRLMDNLENASNSLNKASQETLKLTTQINASGTGEKLSKSMARLDSVLTKIDKGEGTLGALINDPSLHNQLKSLVGGGTSKNKVKNLLRTSIEKDSEGAQ